MWECCKNTSSDFPKTMMPGSIGCHHACLVQSVHEKSLTSIKTFDIPHVLERVKYPCPWSNCLSQNPLTPSHSWKKGQPRSCFWGDNVGRTSTPKHVGRKQTNHFAVTVNISITHFAVWETNFTTDCQNSLLRHHSTHSFGQANWSASVKQLCNKDDLERFSAKKTASLLRASFSNKTSKNCLCYPSIFKTGCLPRLVHVGLRS